MKIAINFNLTTKELKSLNSMKLISIRNVFIFFFFNLMFSSCITWLGNSNDPLDDTQFRKARGNQSLTLSFRFKNIDYSQVTDSNKSDYMPQLTRWMQPGMDKLKERGVFEKVEFIGINKSDQGRHLEILQEEELGTWTVINAILAGFTLNFLPTYLKPDHIFNIKYYENGKILQEYKYRFTFHSLNWNLFLPIWLIYSNQDTNDQMYSTLFEYIARDLIIDDAI